MGQRILGGVVNTLSKQVFQELEQIIEEQKEGEVSEIGTDSKKSKSFIQFIKDLIRKIWR